MSIARPAARCLFCSFSRAPLSTAVRIAAPRASRSFHISFPRRQDNFNNSNSNGAGNEGSGNSSSSSNQEAKSATGDATSVAAKEGVKNPYAPQFESLRDLRPEHFPAYTAEEKAMLTKKYTPEQLASIEAGEASIDPKDLAQQWDPRKDPMVFDYFDDLANIEPVVDHHIGAEPADGMDVRVKDPEEVLDEVAEHVSQNDHLFDDASADGTAGAERFHEYLKDFKFAHGDTTPANSQPPSLVPDLIQPGETVEKIGEKLDFNLIESMEKDQPDSLTPELEALVKTTGYTPEQIRGLRVKSLVNHFVVNQTRMGKVRKTYVLSVAGNGNGLLGIGEGKADDGSSARLQSQYAAVRNMKPILRYENRTIYGDVKGKVGAVELQLMHRHPGFGLRCQQYIWEMCRAAGIHDMAARLTRSRNAMNTIKAAYQALLSQKDPEDIARARGKKMVDVRKVYYAGNV